MNRPQVRTQEIGHALDRVLRYPFDGIEGVFRPERIETAVQRVADAVKMSNRAVLAAQLTNLSAECLYQILMVSGTTVRTMTAILNLRMFSTLQKKGYGAFASSHEILGVLVEEEAEFEEAFSESVDRVVDELYDIAVVAIFGFASISYLDW